MEQEYIQQQEIKKHTGIDLAGTHHAEVISIADGE